VTKQPAPVVPLPADTLNRLCSFVGVERDRLRQALDAASGEAGFYDLLIGTRPHLFSQVAVFLSHSQAARLREIIEVVERVIGLPAYREAVRSWMPETAMPDFGPRGAFLGYDFHLSPDGPKLIEINTNAGGALLNAILASVHRACCAPLEPYIETPPAETPEAGFVEMFRAEWAHQRGDTPLRRIAIVDDAPAGQYLAPEFALFARLFQQHGIEAVIADARELTLENGRLCHRGDPIDFVYNRLTDFALSEPAHAALRDAYLAGQVVLTPHPRAHALYADKRNLTLLTDPALLRAWDVAESDIAVLLSGIPHTERVERAHAESLWATRRQLFFKPAAGYGSKAAYRGDKLTRGTFEDILSSEYVAQQVIAPSERRVSADGAPLLKLDVRAYVYEGDVQLFAARLYRGQTTNFRTPGGGFAAVYVLPDDISVSEADMHRCDPPMPGNA
jgi:hypothetical protein